jgi:hypothetical protein
MDPDPGTPAQCPHDLKHIKASKYGNYNKKQLLPEARNSFNRMQWKNSYSRNVCTNIIAETNLEKMTIRREDGDGSVITSHGLYCSGNV